MEKFILITLYVQIILSLIVDHYHDPHLAFSSLVFCSRKMKPTSFTELFTFRKQKGCLSKDFNIFFIIFSRDEDPVLAKKPDPGLWTSNDGRFLRVF